MLRYLSLLPLIIAVLTSSCARIRTSGEAVDGFGATGEREKVYTSEATLFSDPDKNQLEKANALARDGQYKGAITILQALEDDSNLESELHQEVLLRLAETHGAWDNAFRDLPAGLGYLRKLLNRYPNTKLKPRAEKLITQFSAALER